MKKSIAVASEQYKSALKICRDIFAATGGEFKEPEGVRRLLDEARQLFTQRGDEASATKEVEHATVWLNGIATKLFRTAVNFFGDRVTELSYYSLDRDIMEGVEARLREYEETVRSEHGDSFERRLAVYQRLVGAIEDARPTQRARAAHRDRLAEEQASNKERQRRIRRRENEMRDAEAANAARQAAEAEARRQREELFAELFANV